MTQHQIYDHALKSLMSDKAAEIIPQLIPEAQLVIEQNVEIKRELLRADLVYLIQYQGQPHILNMELQTGTDSEMELRMLLYHVELHIEYRLPVISAVLYLFDTTIPTPPFREMSGEQEILSFHYRVIALWRLNAQEYLEKHIIGMYTLLPAMKGANTSLLRQAIDEIKQRYSRPQQIQHLTRFRIILHRSKTLSEQDKQEVEKYLVYEYDSLLEGDPGIQELVAKGKLELAQKMLVDFIDARFPALTENARALVVSIESLDTLGQLVKLIATAPDEASARWVLGMFAA